jgi:Rap1a immunity proteins
MNYRRIGWEGIVRIIIVGALGLLVSTSANAQSNGNELLGYCERFLNGYKALPDNRFQTANDPVAWQCFGYVTAVSNFAYLHLGTSEATIAKVLSQICLPNGTSVVQLIRVIVNYGRQQPEQLHLPTPLFVLNALGKAFPCQQ